MLKEKEVKVLGVIPEYGKQNDAGFDLRFNFDLTVKDLKVYGDNYQIDYEKKQITFGYNTRILLLTNTILDVPIGHEVQVRPRSGLALKFGLTFVNAPGTIDTGYHGYIGLISYLQGTFDEKIVINDGDRIGQGVLSEYVKAKFIGVNTVEELGESERKSSGFGDSGIK